jgi:cysteine-rich repeat protein
MRTLGRWILVLAAAAAGCGGGEGGDGGRVALALTGQFFPGELASLDVFVYDATLTACNRDDGSLSEVPSAAIASQTALALDAPEEITFTLRPNADYVIYVEAGLRDDDEPLDVVARGCETVSLEDQAEVQVQLRRVATCGDDTLDFQEMCDDGNLEPGDGCDEGCATEPGWVNDYDDYREGRQYQPIAAGRADLLVVCWLTDYSRTWTPLSWFDAEGAHGDPFRESSGTTRRECVDLDVRNDRVLMTINLGAGELETRLDMITAWDGRDQLPEVRVGETADDVVVAAFVGDDEIVAVSLGLGVLTMRSVSFVDLEGDLVLEVDDTPYEVESSANYKLTPAIAGGNGDFVVVWGDDTHEIWARFFESIDAGAEAERLCDASGGCSWPAVASLGGAIGYQYLVAYRGTDDAIVGRLFDMTGRPSDEFDISAAGDCGPPAVAPLDDDDHAFIVVWEQDEEVYARVVDGVGEFAQLATGSTITDQPFLVTPGDGTGYDQPSVATAFMTPDPSTALVFYADERGINDVADGSDSDIGVRLLRVTRPPSGG